MRVIVTQEASSHRLTEAFEEQGADVIHLPAIRIVPPFSWDETDEALAKWNSFDWIVFTSARSVHVLAQRPAFAKIITEKRPRIAAIGPATARAAEDAGLPVSLVPVKFDSRSFSEALKTRRIAAGTKILLPRGDLARRTVPDTLISMGVNLTEITVYRTLFAEIERTELAASLPGAGALVFTSPSAVYSFRNALDEAGWDSVPAGVIVAAIGPTTGDALRETGRNPDRIPPETTFTSLASTTIQAIREKHT